MEKSLNVRWLDWSFVGVFCFENVQGYIMLSLLLLEAILYLYIFLPVLQFHWSKTIELNQNTMACTGHWTWGLTLGMQSQMQHNIFTFLSFAGIL